MERPVHYGNTNCGYCWNLGKPHRGCYPAYPGYNPEIKDDGQVVEDVVAEESIVAVNLQNKLAHSD